MLNEVLRSVKDIDAELKPIINTFLYDYTVQSRMKDTGVLSKEDAIALGAVGPMLRAAESNTIQGFWVLLLIRTLPLSR